MKKQISSVLALMLTVAVLLGCTGVNVFAASQKVTKPALVKAFTVYQMDYAANKWVKTAKTNFKYDKNGYPVLKKLYEYASASTQDTTFDYIYGKNGKPQTRTEKKDGKLEWTVTYNSDGTINRQDCKNNGEKKELIFQYANGAPYFTMVLHNSIFNKLGQPKKVDYTMEEIDSVAVLTQKNGLLKRTTNTGLYANWNNGEEKTWERFNGTYTADYDENGVVHVTSAVYRFGPSGKELSFKLTIKDGRIAQVVQRRWLSDGSKNGKWANEQKIVFQYTDTKIDKIRYAMMINDCVLTSSSTYYIYNWY